MKCILHIGTEKTGTSSLQEFFHLNRKILATRGYLYTKSAGLRNNRALAVAAFRPDRRDDFTKRHGIHNNRDLIAYQTATVNRLRAELRRATNYKTVIFSSEHFQSRLRFENELLQLKNVLNRLGFDQISVVVYLRAPAALASSLYTTEIQAGATFAQPPPPENDHWRNICDHRSTLQRFRDTFGLSAVIPRLYCREDLANGSIIDDFMEAAEIPRDEYVWPVRQNERMTALGLEVLRRINRKVPVFRDDDRPNEIRGNLLSYVKEHLNDGRKYTIPIDVHRQYEHAFRESNEWVREEYFPNRPTLFADAALPCDSDIGWKETDLDQIAEMISEVWLDKSQTVKALGNGRGTQRTSDAQRLMSRAKRLWRR